MCEWRSRHTVNQVPLDCRHAKPMTCWLIIFASTFRYQKDRRLEAVHGQVGELSKHHSDGVWYVHFAAINKTVPLHVGGNSVTSHTPTLNANTPAVNRES